MACDLFFPTPSRPVSRRDLYISFFVWILVVAFWCGSWRLVEEYFLKGEDYYGAWVVTPVAATVCVIITCLKPLLKSILKGQEDEGIYMIITRIFTYFYACVYIIEGVGVWNLINIYHGKGFEKSMIWTAVCFGLAWVFGISSTAMRSPSFIRLDDRERFFKVDSRFSCPTYLFVCFLLDVMCTHYILLPIIIGIWRGFWNVLADQIFPDTEWASYLICLAGGLFILVIMASLQFIFAKVVEDLEKNDSLWNKFFKLVIEDFYHLIVILAQIMAWRGWWMILQVYIFPDTLFGGWMCHVIAFAALIVLQAASTVVGKDIVVDGSKDEGQGILWDVEYTEFFKRQENDENYVKISWI